MVTPVWEQKARDELGAFLKKSRRLLGTLSDRDAVEADTRIFVSDLMVDGLGYDKYEELTAEYLVKGEFADIGIRVDGEILAFVEIKRIGTPLHEKHLRQVKNYAANEGVEWVILTNGRHWHIYHVSNTTPIEHHLLTEVDLLDDTKPAEKVNKLIGIAKDALKRGTLQADWLLKAAVQPSNLTSAVLSDKAISAVRSEIKKITGQNVSVEVLKAELSGLLSD
jgi:predicted type IV restriction endonuclease